MQLEVADMSAETAKLKLSWKAIEGLSTRVSKLAMPAERSPMKQLDFQPIFDLYCESKWEDYLYCPGRLN